MDPYVVLEYRVKKFKTKAMHEAGKTPKWNETFDIDVKYVGDDLNLTIYDSNTNKDNVVA